MILKNRLTLLLLLCMMGASSISFAQGTKESKVTIEMTYQDEDGKKHSETIEYVGKEAESFDADVFEKSLEKRDIKVLNLNINQSVTETSKGELHEEHEHDIKIKQKGQKGKKSVTVKKIIISDTDDNKIMKESMESDSYEVEEKDGKIFINGKEVENGDKQIRIVKSMDVDDEMKVEVKDGKVFINGEEVNKSDMSKSSKHKVIIKRMHSEPGEYSDHVITDKFQEIDLDTIGNIWISNDGTTHDIDKESHSMIFISDDEAKKPRLGIMIEDGKAVNGAEIIDLVPDSPAAKAGLRKGDTVTAINDEPVYGVTSMMDKVSNFKSGDEVNVTYSRDGKTMTSLIKLKMMDTKIEKNVFIKKEKN